MGQGTTSLGIKGTCRHVDSFCSTHRGSAATNGIVIATEKKAPSILIDDSMIEKVAIICPNIGMVYSGMGPDFRVLVAKARKSAQAYWKIYGEYPPTKVLTQEIATIMQQATHSGYVVPRRGSGATCTDAAAPSQRCPTLWRLPPHRRLGHHARAHPVPGRPLRVLLGLEGERNWQEHGEREDFPGKAVRQSIFSCGAGATRC